MRDEDSIARWGEHWGPNISDDRFTDANAMKDYALKSMQTQPLTEITIMYDGNDEVQPGEVWLLNVESQHFITEVTVDGIKEYPLSPSKAPEITLDNSYKTLYDYDRQLQKDVNIAINGMSNYKPYTPTITFGDKVGEVND